MVHGKNRIPYWIDRRLTGLAVPEYHAIISFGLPIEPEDSQYGEYRIRCVIWSAGQASMRGSGGGASSDDNPISRARECPVAFLIS